MISPFGHMNYPVFLVGVPLGFASNTYFPVESDRPWLTLIAQLNPIYWLSESYRAMLVRGTIGMEILWLTLLALAFLVIFGFAAHRLTRRRVLGE